MNGFRFCFVCWQEPTEPLAGGLPNTVDVLGVSWDVGVTFAYLSRGRVRGLNAIGYQEAKGTTYR